MKLFHISIKNLICNFSFYSLYLLSISFVLMIFFCFISFANNEIIMEKISSDGRVEVMCSIVAVFIVVFVFFFMANAKSMILLILLSAGTLAILGATTLSLWYPIEAIKRMIPSAIEFRAENKEQARSVIHALSQTIGDNSFQTYETTVIRITATSNRLPYEYSISEEKGRTPSLECISEHDYIQLLNLQGKKTQVLSLNENESILIKYRIDEEKTDVGAIYSLNLTNGNSTDVKVIATTLNNAIGFANSVGTLVISDTLYKKLLVQSNDTFSILSINGTNLRENEQAYRTVYNMMPDNIFLASAYQKRAELIYYNSPTFLLISFATVIFLIATGSILYFQNLSAISYDKADYIILAKMGYAQKQLQKIIRIQVQIYFLIPYTIGSLHSIFAILCYKYVLVDDVIGNNISILFPIGFSVFMFTIIYFIYYQITKHSCYKAVLS